MISPIARKVVLLGPVGVGKTSLSNRLAFDRFEASYKATLGVDVYTVTVQLGDGARPFPIVLWDTDGDFGLSIFRTVHIKGAAAAIIVGDITRPATLDEADRLLAGFREILPGRPAWVFLNKADLLTDGPAMPDARFRAADGLAVTSARTGHGAREALRDLVGTVHRRKL